MGRAGRTGCAGGGALGAAHGRDGQVESAGGFGRADELGERGDGGGVLPGGVVPGGVGLGQLLLGVADPVGGVQHQHVCVGLLAGAVLGGGEGDPLVVLAFGGTRPGAGHGPMLPQPQPVRIRSPAVRAVSLGPVSEATHVLMPCPCPAWD